MSDEHINTVNEHDCDKLACDEVARCGWELEELMKTFDKSVSLIKIIEIVINEAFYTCIKNSNSEIQAIARFTDCFTTVMARYMHDKKFDDGELDAPKAGSIETK